MARLTGWELEAALSRLGTTTREVADASGIPEPDIARYLTDDALPFNHAARITRALWRIEAEKLLADAGLEPCPELAYLVRERHRDPDAIDVHITTCAVCQERAALVQDRLGRSPSWLTTTLDAFFGGLSDAPSLLAPILTGMIVVAAVVTIPLGIVLVRSVFTGKLDTLVPLFVLSATALVGGAGAGLVWTLTPALPRAGAPGRYLRAILTMWGFFACVAIGFYLWSPVKAWPVGGAEAWGVALGVSLPLGVILGAGMAIGVRSPPRLPEEPVIHTRRGLALYAVGVAVLLVGIPPVFYALQRHVISARRQAISARPTVSHQSAGAPRIAQPDTDLTHALALLRAGRAPDADRYVRRAAARDSDDAMTVRRLGEVLVLLDSAGPAMDFAARAAARDTGDAAMQVTAALIAYNTQKFDTGYAYARRAVQLDSTEYYPWVVLGRLAFCTNRMNESAKDYRRAWQIYPDYFRYAQLDARIRNRVAELVKGQ